MMMFSAKDFQLRQWTVTDPQGYDTTVAVYNLDTSREARSGHVQASTAECPGTALH